MPSLTVWTAREAVQGGILALAGAGFVASAHAAEHTSATAAMEAAFECAGGVRLGYDVAYEQRIGGFAVVGVELSDFPARCAGRAVVVEVLGSDGASLGSAPLELVDGAVATFADDVPVDARDVTGLRVLPG